jgi:hypothetical protein
MRAKIFRFAQERLTCLKHKLCKYGGLANIAVLFAFQI